MLLRLGVTILILILHTSCHKEVCSRFYSYNSKSVDIKGIKKKYNSKEDFKEFSVGSVVIKNEFIEASERLQELDLLQYSLCSQIRNMRKNDPKRQELIELNSATYRDMLKIAQQSTDLPISQQLILLSGFKEEFNANLKTINALKLNTETLVSQFLLVADTLVLRNPKIKILPILFPSENATLKNEPSPNILAEKAVAKLDSLKLANDKNEVAKFLAIIKVVRVTISKTKNTMLSLTDSEGKRYFIYDNFWNSNSSSIRRISQYNCSGFQRTYSTFHSVRSNYDIVSGRVIDYFSAVEEFCQDVENGKIDRFTVGKVLSSERLALQLIHGYLEELTKNIEETISIINEIEKIK